MKEAASSSEVEDIAQRPFAVSDAASSSNFNRHPQVHSYIVDVYPIGIAFKKLGQSFLD